MTDRPTITIDPAVGPYAEVRQVGRWRHVVAVHDGLLLFAPDGYGWVVFGRRRAERLAARQLARYVRRQGRKAAVSVVRLGEPSAVGGEPKVSP